MFECFIELSTTNFVSLVRASGLVNADKVKPLFTMNSG